jgi:hypothetical protein
MQPACRKELYSITVLGVGPRRLHHDSCEDSPRRLRRGRAFVYVLPCAYEDILKLGFSREPLHRLQQFHPRYFDFFDLRRAFMIEADTVADARRLEKRMATLVELHSAPAPLVISRDAAGHTEWYRGAHTVLTVAAEGLRAAEGYRLHAPLSTWVAHELRQRSDLLFEWTNWMIEAIRETQAIEADTARALEVSLSNTLDAYASLGLQIETEIPRAVQEWHRK